MLLSILSPRGGRPLRTWAVTHKKGHRNLLVAESDESPRIMEDSTYCIKRGYYEDGTEVLIRDKDAFQLYKLLHRQYKGA